jgi:hypothetical protein
MVKQLQAKDRAIKLMQKRKNLLGVSATLQAILQHLPLMLNDSLYMCFTVYQEDKTS